MRKLIDQQAALDAVDDIHQEHLYRQIGDRDTYTPYNEGWADACNRIDAALSALPSAQPEERTDKRTETNASDLIYRQAVLALPRNIERNAFGEVVEENINVVHVKGIPSVDAVPVRRGRWIRDEFGSRCECCGLYAYRDKAERPWESDYCPYCGADLRGKKHEGSD